MSEHPGLGVLIHMLSDDRETDAKAIEAAVSQPIEEIGLEESRLRILLRGGRELVVWDDGQSCCELRYMTTDDDLSVHVGAELRAVEERAAPNREDEYGEHEVQFLVVTTSAGQFTIETHNEHNGYYGGFWLKASLSDKEGEPCDES